MFGLVTGVVLILSSGHIQEAVHYCHTLVEALRWQLREVTPGGSALTRVPPQNLEPKKKSVSLWKKLPFAM